MKQIEKFTYHAAVYTVAITVIFYLFSFISGLENADMTFSRFILILLYGSLISGAEFVFIIEKLHTALKYTIHCLALFAGFFVIFLAIRSESGTFSFTAATMFAAAIIFIAIYSVIALASFLIRRMASKNGKQSSPAKSKNKPYQNRFGA